MAEPAGVTSGNGCVRVLTWNVHRSVGPDGRYDPGRVVRLVQAHAPDVVAIQELDTRGLPTAHERTLALLTDAFGPHTVEARTITAADGHYGHAVISRWPLTDAVLHDLSVGKREPRSAIECRAATPGGELRVIAAHLGLGPIERARQAALLSDVACAGDGPTIVLGDFNDWLWRGPVRRALARAFPERTDVRTFPACWPLLPLDRVYGRPIGLIRRARSDPAGRRASDHLPLVVDLELPGLPDHGLPAVPSAVYQTSRQTGIRDQPPRRRG